MCIVFFCCVHLLLLRVMRSLLVCYVVLCRLIVLFVSLIVGIRFRSLASVHDAGVRVCVVACWLLYGCDMCASWYGLML